MTQATCLPNLLYIADVPVEATFHGSVLIYRLLQDYPAEKLLIIEAGSSASAKPHRLREVRYEVMPPPGQRLLRTRAYRVAASLCALHAPLRSRKAEGLIKHFQPQAVLTVAHGFSWMTAAAIARDREVPLHLIVHDDPHATAVVANWLRAWFENRFSDIYRNASSRLCISPSMVEEYQNRYGISGTVLYPQRSMDIKCFDTPPTPANRPFTVGYAGTLNTGDYRRQLAVLSRLLQQISGILLIYGPVQATELATPGVVLECVKFGGVVSSEELCNRLRSEADVLFVPMSFAPGEAVAFRLNFPSKLAVYTAAALPLLIWGPSGSSAVRWAAGEPGVAAVVTDPDERSIAGVLAQLKKDPGWRYELGRTAAIVGKRYFSAAGAKDTFNRSIETARPPAG